MIGEPRSLLFRYGMALFNAWVLAKIVLIGNLARLGKFTERNPLIVPILVKAFLFTVFGMTFHVLEAIVHDLLHGQPFLGAVKEIGEIARFGVIMFFAFIPFFAVVEIRRVLGPETFQDLFVGGALHHSKDATPGSQIRAKPAT
jgi:hypothetical protein